MAKSKNLTAHSITRLTELLSAASAAGIDNMKIVTRDGVPSLGGIDENQSVLVIGTHDLPDFNGLDIAIQRPAQLLQRMNFVRDQSPDDFTLAADEGKAGQVARLLITAKKTNVEQRTASQDAFRVPSPHTMKDTTKFKFTVAKADLQLLVKGSSIIDATSAVITCISDSTIMFEIVNKEMGDNFSHEVDTTLEIMSGDTTPKFTFQYHPKKLIGLIKYAITVDDEVTFSASEKGFLSIIISGYNFMLFPQV